MVTVTFAAPEAWTGVGRMLPERICPLVGLSRRKLTVCPSRKPAICPVRVAGSALTVWGLSARLGASTLTAALFELSPPRQLLLAGVTV
jgi:hypothetical protein